MKVQRDGDFDDIIIYELWQVLAMPIILSRISFSLFDHGMPLIPDMYFVDHVEIHPILDVHND